MARLTLSALVVGRGATAVAGPFEIAVSAGEALVVTGPNGAGKSTLLRTLAGLLPPISGTVRLEGLAASDGEPAARLADVAHYVGHRHGMKSQITVGENLRFWARYLGGAAKEIARRAGDAADRSLGDRASSLSQDGRLSQLTVLPPAEALAAVGLPGLDAIPFGYLSAGQQRRASLARLLVAHRPVWILDEPTSALDVASQARFADLVARHLGSGGIVVAATHHPLGLESAKTLHITPPRAGRDDGPGAPAIDDAALAEAEGWL
ncbi:heme ABC exporter ATP-binding protein CcmA [Jiella avicenniae]|uniref:Heme ABC exporter ATP-binding protein CcmA n=1 Tax=Jiella avicenniae TaxID=2907202 RepID=A0A9X1P168_9HYPH|nr:heme ABC exporter ATP-binding protein CcmA [Jiella avicenniae]MCE7029177.1 heme ABC exporter ATP-binding protein CcmA [Jiella avicenniae]